MMTFSEKLVVLRKIKHLTQDEFASAVGVSRQAVYKWESGQSYPEVQKLREMKLLFGISIDDLLDDTFEIELPKKKRKKRLSKEEKARIEAEVRADEKAKDEAAAVEFTAPKKETAAPAPKAEVKAEPKASPAVKPAAPKEEAKPAPKAEVKAEPKAVPTAKPAAPKEEAKPAPKAEVKEDKSDKTEDLKKQVYQKGGLFDRLFGNKK